MTKSDSIKSLAAALSVFHSQMKPVKRDATNPFFKSKYADLASILEAIKQPLLENELSYVQFPVGDGGLTTILMHSSGEYIEETFFMRPVGTKPQDLGSALTYARRYALGAVLGIATESDDDGATASKGKQAAATAMNASQRAEIDRYAEQLGITKAQIIKRCKELYGISIIDLNETQASGVIAGLKKKLEEKK